MNWTPQTKVGIGLLVAVTLTCLALVCVDHGLTAAWTVIGQVVAVAAKMAGAG